MFSSSLLARFTLIATRLQNIVARSSRARPRDWWIRHASNVIRLTRS